MKNSKRNLQDELLGQNGISDGSVSDEDRKRLALVITKGERRLRAWKRGRLVLWVAVAVWPLLAGLLALLLRHVGESQKLPYLVLCVPIWYGLIILAIIDTIRVHLFSRTLDIRRIQNTLARIADQLEQLSKKG